MTRYPDLPLTPAGIYIREMMSSEKRKYLTRHNAFRKFNDNWKKNINELWPIYCAKMDAEVEK